VSTAEPFRPPGADVHQLEVLTRLVRWRGPAGLVLSDVLFAVAALVAVAVIVYLGRYTTFYFDEWTFIVDRREWTLNALMRPHNEHWALVPAIAYKLLFSTIGLRSYLPYLLVLMAVHVAAASSVYVLMRRLNGQLPALAAGTLVLFLGTGDDNLFWAFQMGFAGAAAAGAWAIVLLITSTTRRAGVAAAALLTVAVATQGSSLFFLVAVAVMLALDPPRWRRLWVVLPATVAFGAWYVAIGSASISIHRDPFTLAGLQQLPSYVVTGASYAFGRLTGWGEQVGLVLFVVLGIATALHVSGHRRLRAAAIAGFAGLIAQYAITGTVRAQLGLHQATASRYVYVAAILILIATAGWIGLRFAELRLRPMAVLGAAFVLALGANLSAMPGGRDVYVQRAQATRASIMIIDAYGGSPAVPLEASLWPVPAKGELERIRRDLGLPLPDAILPDAPPPDPALLDAQLYLLVGAAFHITAADKLPASVATPAVESTVDVETSESDGCVEARVAGPEPQIVMRVAGGTALAIETEQVGQGRAYLALNAPPTETNSKLVDLSPGGVDLVATPDIGESRPWKVRFDLPPSIGATRVCEVAGPDLPGAGNGTAWAMAPFPPAPGGAPD
jgi:hypothetical protein